MIVISKSTLKKFLELHPSAAGPVWRWYSNVKEADWKELAALKRSFPATDYIGNDLYVFNLGGNNYRLIARIFFSVRTVFIRFIGTHNEYDKLKQSGL